MSILKAMKIVLLISLFTISKNYSQSFSYYSSGTPVVPYGATSTQTTYYFSYSNLSGLHSPCLVVFLDDNIISNSLCNLSVPPSVGQNFSII